MSQLKIYTASKLHHAEMWKALSFKWPFQFTARWFQYHVGRVPDSPSFAKFFWVEDYEDVTAADCVVVYAEPTDVLRGALVEAGMAIAQHKPVICVGENDGFGTWADHPSVYRVKNLEEARVMLDMMQNAKGW